MRKVIFLAAVFSFIPLSTQAVETVNSVYFEGAAPIVVDGDLSDWAFVTSGPVPITNTMLSWWNNNTNSEIPIKSLEDLSGSFQCFYDAYNLYFSVKVNDDKFMSGREPFAFNLYDDCVEISFNGDSDKWFETGNYGQIRVFADERIGKTHIEMRGLFPPWQIYPYIWEDLGVKANLKRNEQGYTVEVAIPTNILGWSAFKANRLIGLNIKINDKDEIGDKDCALVWAQDLNENENQWHNLVSFDTPVLVSKDSQPVSNSGSETKNIIAVLDNPDKTQSFDNVKAIYRAYSQKDYIETERLLNSCSNNKYWKQFFLGNIRFDTKKYLESAQIMLQLANDSPDLCLSRLAIYKAGRAFMRAGDKMKALDIFEEVLTSTMEHQGGLGFVVFNMLGESVPELLKNESNNSIVSNKADVILEHFLEACIKNQNSCSKDGLFDKYLNYYLSYLTINKNYDKAIQMLELLNNNTIDQKVIFKSLLEIAKVYLQEEDYDKSEKICNDIIDTDSDKINKNTANSILHLIAIKRKLKIDVEQPMQNETISYNKKDIMKAPWGKGYNEIGYIDKIRKWNMDFHCGASSFDIDKNNNIYILDTVNNEIKIFDQIGNYLNNFSIYNSGETEGSISVDNNLNIWVHDPLNQTFSEWSNQGKLIKSIFYGSSLAKAPSNFTFYDNNILIGNSIFEISGISSKKGVNDETVYNANLKCLNTNSKLKGTLGIFGKYSKRFYKIEDNRFTRREGLLCPKISTQEEDGNIKEYEIKDIDPLYSLRYLSEDKDKNIYFLATYEELKRDSKIYKYDVNFKLITIIDTVLPSNYFYTKEISIDENGMIFIMMMSEEGIKINKISGGLK
ncbi:MAG: sugar-binding protein [Candidatus Latescibacterota bacterium]